MRALSYTRATDVTGAVAAVTKDPGSSFLAGGTTEVDLIRLDVLRPNRLVDINRLPLAGIEDRADGGLVIGALARMSEVAEAPGVVERYPMLSQSLLLGASAQLRNMASMGGNLMQRVRCSYYRDPESACNKRVPGSGCSALEGVHRGHAILGTSEHCIATHPSDLAVALVALDAVVHVEGVRGARTLPVDDFFLLPGRHPEREHPLTPGELITAIEVPRSPWRAGRSTSRCATGSPTSSPSPRRRWRWRVADGVIRGVRLALGGVGDQAVAGAPGRGDAPGAARRRGHVRAGRGRGTGPAVTRPMNAFKAELARRTVVRALRTAGPARRAGMTTGALSKPSAGPSTGSTVPPKSPDAARYAAEFTLPGTAYAALVGARTADGRITGINTRAAEDADGVLAVLTHRNLPKVAAPPHLLPSLAGHAAPGESFFPMQDEVVHYFGQPVAMVIADSCERAQFAARQVHVDYARGASVTTLDEGRDQAYEPEAIFAGFVPAAACAVMSRPASRGGPPPRRHLPFRREPPQPHRTLGHHGGLGRRPTHPLRRHPGHRGQPEHRRGAAGHPPVEGAGAGPFVGGGFGCKAMIWPHVPWRPWPHAGCGARSSWRSPGSRCSPPAATARSRNNASNWGRRTTAGSPHCATTSSR